MKRAILCLSIFLISYCAKSQVVWSPGFVKSLEEFIFIPVEFDHFGNWMAEIENDTSLIFTKKEFTIEENSLNLDFNLQKQNFPSPFNNSSLSVNIFGFTRNYTNLKEIVRESRASISLHRLPPQKVTTIYIISKISFDSTDEGKLLAAQAMKNLELKFSGYFDGKKVIKSHKNIRKRKHHPQIEKQIRFSIKENPVARFWINNATFSDRNEIALYLAYELN